MIRQADRVRPLVFTDLDGSLLDHDSYSFAPAAPVIKRLKREDIPLIFVSSKTRAEIMGLREQLENQHPFVVENGAAVFIPQGYFRSRPENVVSREGFWVFELSEPRSKWLGLLQHAKASFDGEFDCFEWVGAAGVAQMTGLSLAQAELANRREYSEAVRWLGSDARKEQFIKSMTEEGANVLQGGRFLGVAGPHDKGAALAWLRHCYEENYPGVAFRDLAIGDSLNDAAMLDAAGSALLIRSPVHEFPPLRRSTQNTLFSRSYGPSGWAEGVAQWLDEIAWQ